MSDEKRSHVNASELRATFTDYDDPHAPYEGLAMVLKLSGDIAFISIGTLTECLGSDRFDHDDKLAIGVDAEVLYETLGAMLRRDDRLAYDRLLEGTLQSTDPRLRNAVRTLDTPAIRRRA